MHVPKLKVRPRKVQPYVPCREELAVMLGCWATTGDFASLGQCAQAAETLHHCMRTAPLPSKAPRPAINYHLARLKKNLK